MIIITTIIENIKHRLCISTHTHAHIIIIIIIKVIIIIIQNM